MDELEALLILNAIPGLSNFHLRELLEKFDSAKKILMLNWKDLSGEGKVCERLSESIQRFPQDNFLREEFKLIKEKRIRLLSFQDEDYPENLKEIPDAPVILYLKGNLERIMPLAIAVVGSRRASIYGLTVAEKMARGLSELGITVVSGMARGIDTAAHRATLKVKGDTIAVLGCGLTHIYPSENQRLYEEIAARGLVLSEFPMQRPPLAYNFPRRNRIISGLSLGVIVVEASQRSGALITSRFALEQGREIFAVPGQLGHPNSVGVHNLIKQGAKLINCLEDVIVELAPQIKQYLVEQKKSREEIRNEKKRILLSKTEEQIYHCIENKPIHIDVLIQQVGFSIPFLTNILLKLELKHLVKQLPGKLFVRMNCCVDF